MVSTIGLALSIYLAVGALFAGWFAARGVERLDTAAHGAPWTFRLLITPGVMVLWPWLLTRLLRTHHASDTP